MWKLLSLLNMNKDLLRKKFSSDYKNYYAVNLFETEGFSRKQCSNCVHFFKVSHYILFRYFEIQYKNIPSENLYIYLISWYVFSEVFWWYSKSLFKGLVVLVTKRLNNQDKIDIINNALTMFEPIILKLLLP